MIEYVLVAIAAVLALVLAGPLFWLHAVDKHAQSLWAHWTAPKTGTIKD